MYQIAQHLQNDYACYFSPYYADSWVRWLAEHGFLDNSIMGTGGKHRNMTETFLKDHALEMDYRGEKRTYDLTLLCQDVFVPQNIRQKPVILVQEGMIDPKDWRYKAAEFFGLPRFVTNTAMTGQSHAYEKFCVASDGFRQLFIERGVRAEKMVITGVPNFDQVTTYQNNDFPHHHYVLAATSAIRESWKYEDRKGFILDVKRIANGRQIIFKLHPNENQERAIREIKRELPQALIYTTGNTEEMIANCDVLVTKYSSVLLVALALGKEVHCDIPKERHAYYTPDQNGGTSSQKIADLCRTYL